ncbi:hypothetical protein SAMN05443572_106452 [Myxococcus fulvus]|uniref:Uncharacterized protein n=1 Tax=Myxococcus fulvus TaxID=33 RepID=A0ABY1CMJ2_MYXFU|nr:hypothetical protein SAMN05443572_106452 [Myxococcus fulvus]
MSTPPRSPLRADIVRDHAPGVYAFREPPDSRSVLHRVLVTRALGH